MMHELDRHCKSKNLMRELIYDKSRNLLREMQAKLNAFLINCPKFGTLGLYTKISYKKFT